MDLTQGESFGFLGFEFRRIRSRHGRWMPLRTPRGKKRTALLRTAQAGLSKTSVPTGGRGDCADQSHLRGWVQYFAVGHSSRCFSYIRDWVEKKIRRHLARASQRHGFGWKRWSRAWLYGTSDFSATTGSRIWPRDAVPPQRSGPITLGGDAVQERVVR